MLSVTYAQTALKVEQDNVRSELRLFQRYLQDRRKESKTCSRQIFEQLLDKLKKLHLSCRWRRLEVLVLPEIRDATASADQVIAELESMRLLGFDLYRLIRDQLRSALQSDDFRTSDLYRNLELYCQTIHGMIEKEERELLTAMFDWAPADKWFRIAEKFMLQDKENIELGQVRSANIGQDHSQQQHSRQPLHQVKSVTSGPAQPDQQAESHSDECIARYPLRHSSKGGGRFVAQAARCN